MAEKVKKRMFSVSTEGQKSVVQTPAGSHQDAAVSAHVLFYGLPKLGKGIRVEYAVAEINGDKVSVTVDACALLNPYEITIGAYLLDEGLNKKSL